jgi:hypothetical protein
VHDEEQSIHQYLVMDDLKGKVNTHIWGITGH